MSKNTILIDGAKLREIIEQRLDLTIYSIARVNGYSANLVAQALRSGKASPLVQNLLRLYKVEPKEYELKEPIQEGKQITIDDITALNREELKALIKEALNDILYNSELVIKNDPKRGTRLYLQERGLYKNEEVK